MDNFTHKQSAQYVEPGETARNIRGFLSDASKRLMLLTGVSGIGKSTVLRHIDQEIISTYYIDLSIRNTVLDILQETYRIVKGKDDLLQSAVNECRSLYSFYLNNVGNISTTKSVLTDTVIESSVRLELKPSAAEQGLFYQTAKKIVFESLPSNRFCFLFDQFEEASDNEEIRAFIRSLFVDSTSACFVLASKKDIKNDILDDYKTVRYSPQGFTQIETSLYLSRRGISSANSVDLAFQFSAGHPLFLKILADAMINGLNIDRSMATATEDERFKYLVHCIGNSLPFQLRRVFYHLPLCRYFTKDLLRNVFELDAFSANEITRLLCDELYAERVPVPNVNLIRFHQLFTNLQRREVPKDEQVKFDRRVVSFYEANHFEKKSFNFIHEITEPFYHLQHVSSEDAFEYFERHYKPILDTKQKGIAGILMGQVRFDLINDLRIRNWYLLRVGGFFREFGIYGEAEKHFIEILKTPFLDKKLTAYAHNNLGICYLFTEKYDLCHANLEKSNAICDELALAIVKAHNLNNIGICWGYKGDHTQEKESYEQSYRLYCENKVEGLYLGKLLQNYTGYLESGNCQ